MEQQVVNFAPEITDLIKDITPAILTLLGTFLGIIGTYLVTRLNNKHNEKMYQRELDEAEKIRQIDWERSEERRKEERLYNNKLEAYKKILTWIDEKNDGTASLSVILNSFTAISLFAPNETRDHIAEIVKYFYDLKKRDAKVYTKEEDEKTIEMLNRLHGMLMDDLDKHN